MTKKYDVICVGTALVDSIIKGFDPKPVSATGYRAESSSLNVGGEAVNEAMAASKLGLKTGIFCSLGKDAAGDMVAAALESCGVDTGMILRSAEYATPVTTMFVSGDGTRKSITNGAHRYNFHPERNACRFTDARALILGSLFRAPFDDPKIIYDVLLAAKENGKIVFADTKLPNFNFLKLEDLRCSAPMIDYITPNEDEARCYTGETEPEKMAEAFLQWGAKNVVIKLGGSGCYFKNAADSFMLPAYSIHAADATGAGDNFVAGFVSEVLRGESHETALRFANVCGAICSMAVGAGTALKSREQVLSFMAKEGDAV